MTKTLNIDGIQTVYSECITCGVQYSVPETRWNHQKKTGGFHYCSNGHKQGWNLGNTEDDVIRRERDRLQQQTAQLQDEIKAAKRRTAAAKGQLTKHQKRSAAGTCPCCNRSFQNMSRHMKNQHPDFVEKHTAQIGPLKPRNVS